MRVQRLITLIIGLLLAVQVAAAAAGGAVFWEITKQTDIERGDANGISISDNGVIKLAPSFTELFNTEQPLIFSSTSDSAGNIYLGTGHEGRVFKVDKNGKGSMLFDANELDITALAVDNAGNLYAGSSPEGKIYRITPDGKANPFFDPEDKYIWSLAFDKSGNLFVGSGDKGIIYKVDSSGKGVVFAKTNEKHAITLTFDNRGNLLAGTDPNGLVLRISPDGKVFALADTPIREIHKLAVAADGSIYALGLTANQSSSDKSTSTAVTTTPVTTSSSDSSGTVTVTFEDDSVTSASSTPTTSSRTIDTTTTKAILYKITPEGGYDALWNTREAIAFALAINKNNEVLIGTASKGRIYAIDPNDKTATVLLQSTEEQTTTLVSTNNGIYATSSNTGKLFRIGGDTVKEGYYISPIHDTKFTANWGRIAWRGNGQIQLQTRSGNTETPDATWSDWSAPYEGKESQQVTSPAARFIQWRAKLQNQGSLNAVKLAYLPRNVAPDVTQVTVLQPGIALQEVPQQPIDPGILSAGLDPATFGLPTNIQPRKVFQKGARSLQWQSEDRNGDTLTYSIYYRTAQEADWHLLTTELKGSYYTIDADSLPDGKYLFRVIATDVASNSVERALKGEQISDLVEIDNTPPQVMVSQPRVTGRKVDATFSANDNLSNLKRAEYSLDGGNWQVIFPDDGIADSRTEVYTVKLELPTSGEHVIAFRCYDESANSGGNKVTVKAGN